MTQDERWLTRYDEVLSFMEREHRNPSKLRIEEHDMLNWMKANRKLVNLGEDEGGEGGEVQNSFRIGRTF